MNCYRVTLQNKESGKTTPVLWLSASEEKAKTESETAHPGYECITVQLRANLPRAK